MVDMYGVEDGCVHHIVIVSSVETNPAADCHSGGVGCCLHGLKMKNVASKERTWTDCL